MMKDMIKWDLSQLVDDSGADPIIAALDRMVADAGKFRERYQGKITALDAPGVLAFLEERDSLFVRHEGPIMFCQLMYSADSTDPVAKRLNDAVRKAGTRAGQEMAFSDIELGQLLKKVPALADDPMLKEYGHYLERVRARVPHLLSETEERLIMAKDQNGVDAWSQLQQDWLSTRTFRMTVDGEEKDLAYGEVISFYSDPDREKRRSANSIVYTKLGQDDILWSSAVRSICADHLHMCEWRKYQNPIDPSLLDNDVEAGAVDALMRVMRSNAGTYRRYLRLKAKLLGLDVLGNWDLQAPLPDAPDRRYDWAASRETVTRAYNAFDPQFAQWVGEMYDRDHLDAEPRKGKASGAFCSYWYSGKSAYILQSFNGRRSDVYTQAHELGHAIHAYLASRAQKLSNFSAGSCIAETGSIFGELLLTDQLLKEATSEEEQLAVLDTVWDEFGMAAFQVSARFHFEQSMYDAIKGGKVLDGETVAALWTKARDDVYGDAVQWLPEMKWEWTMKMHYYIPNYRFYNYPYVFAQLFVFALYRLYQEQGKAFVPKMKALLSAGSSRSPAQLAEDQGFDITTEEFWQKGIDQAEAFLERMEELAGKGGRK
ncbi:MAG: M3 family oligoendopeptidase [Methanomassiliicoccus sp.]|nr:M3 family oligoendopeptidase [Methanomassiliicoccus sp.]